MLYYHPDARRQFASERVADLAQEARRLPQSAADADARSRSRFAAWLLLQARQLREHALSRAPAFRA